MLSEALQRKAKHVAGLSNISGHCLRVAAQKTSDILRFAESDTLDDR